MHARTLVPKARKLGTALCLGAALLLVGCQEALYSGLTEREANQMRQALVDKGISAEKRAGEGGRHTLFVKRDDAVAALRVLEAVGLPSKTFTPGIDLLKSDALVSSPAEDRARMAYALSQDLSATISGIDGVVTARVHLVLPDKPLMASSRQSVSSASASVLVTYRPGHNLDAASLSIRQLVARSVDGLTPEKVSVVLMPAQTMPVSSAPVAANGPAGVPTELSLAASALTLVIGLLGGWGFAQWRAKAKAAPRPTARPTRPARPGIPATQR